MLMLSYTFFEYMHTTNFLLGRNNKENSKYNGQFMHFQNEYCFLNFLSLLVRGMVLMHT